MKEYNKLVRDRILEIIKADGIEPTSRVLTEEEYKQELLKKLVEEANEALAAGNNIDELTKELGDVWEVIEHIMKAFPLNHEKIQALKQERHEKRGGFDEKIFLEFTNE